MISPDNCVTSRMGKSPQSWVYPVLGVLSLRHRLDRPAELWPFYLLHKTSLEKTTAYWSSTLFLELSHLHFYVMGVSKVILDRFLNLDDFWTWTVNQLVYSSWTHRAHNNKVHQDGGWRSTSMRRVRKVSLVWRTMGGRKLLMKITIFTLPL